MDISNFNIPTWAPTTLSQPKLTPLKIFLFSINATPFFQSNHLECSLILLSHTSYTVCQQMLLAQAPLYLSHFHRVQTAISYLNYYNNLLTSTPIYVHALLLTILNVVARISQLKPVLPSYSPTQKPIMVSHLRIKSKILF